MRVRLLGVVLGVVALLGATVTPATAATLRRAVALQVQFPSGTVRTWCVPYVAGMSGAEVLARATPTYGSGPYAGFVLQINGSGKVPPTSSRYWAYWRSPAGTASGYAYSSAGVTATRPPLHSVETWVWTTGASTPVPRKSFAELCSRA